MLACTQLVLQPESALCPTPPCKGTAGGTGDVADNVLPVLTVLSGVTSNPVGIHLHIRAFPCSLPFGDGSCGAELGWPPPIRSASLASIPGGWDDYSRLQMRTLRLREVKGAEGGQTAGLTRELGPKWLLPLPRGSEGRLNRTGSSPLSQGPDPPDEGMRERAGRPQSNISVTVKPEGGIPELTSCLPPSLISKAT